MHKCNQLIYKQVFQISMKHKQKEINLCPPNHRQQLHMVTITLECLFSFFLSFSILEVLSVYNFLPVGVLKCLTEVKMILITSNFSLYFKPFTVKLFDCPLYQQLPISASHKVLLVDNHDIFSYSFILLQPTLH